ncbi:MAG: ABC transporter permease, partial [Streptosporangiaceae bacterium]
MTQRTGSEKTPRTAHEEPPGTPRPPSTREGAVRRVAELTRRVYAASTFWIFGVLVILVIGFSIARPDAFPTPFNAESIATDAATLLVMSMGMTFVIITAGIDLSVGSVLVFSGVVAAKVMLAVGGPDAGWGAILVGLVAGLGGGLAWGLFNGFLVAKARVPALIVTLGSFGMALGFAQIITGGTDVRDVPARLTSTIGIGKVFGVLPWIVVIAAIVTVIGGMVLWFTKFGRYTYAIGSNAEAARRSGIRVTRHLLTVYAVTGLLAGLAGDLSLARFATTTLTGHTTDNLDTIAAVVLGGTSLFGGIGTIFGTVVGVFIPAVLRSG